MSEGAAGGRLRSLGALCVLFYAIHAGYHLAHQHPEDLLWACHLGALIAGIGLLAGSARACAVGFLWLCMGDVLWGLDLATGGVLIPTSLLTHVGGLLLSSLGVARLGMPRYAASRAILAFLVLQQLCRWITPAAANINLAHAVWPGWEPLFPSYWAYQAMLVLIGWVSFSIVERLFRRVRAGPRT